MAGRQPQIYALPLKLDGVGVGQVATMPGIRKQLTHCRAIGIAAHAAADGASARSLVTASQ